MKRLPRKFNNSRLDDVEDRRNAEKFNMTVAEWKRTNADRVADRVGQRDLDIERQRRAEERR